MKLLQKMANYNVFIYAEAGYLETAKVHKSILHAVASSVVTHS